MRCGVIVFPGSNCDTDCEHALTHLGFSVRMVWHHEEDLSDLDCIVLPGGFSYGDYLRTGAIARFSPIMRAVPGFRDRGGLVIGICNGFQILLEAGLLPGAMLQNTTLSFRCEYVHLRVENNETAFTSAYRSGHVISLPIAHHAGNYYAPPEVVAALENDRRVVLRYAHPDGSVDDAANPNGSVANIAGIIDETGRVFGLMPHPERAVEDLLGSEDGRGVFRSMASAALVRHD